MPLVDMTGMKVGRWAVIERVVDDRPAARWRCACVCGTEKVLSGQTLRNGDSMSCGCRPRRKRTHGRADSPEYKIWRSMKARCSLPSQRCYANYGARGIRVCDRWQSFAAFFQDMGERPTPDHSIDRIDNEGNYEPTNCRWATRTEQNRNTRVTAMSEEDYRVAYCLRRLGIPLRWIGDLMGVSGARIHAVTRGCRYVRIARADKGTTKQGYKPH